MSETKEVSVELWYANVDSADVEHVKALPRQRDYYWVSSKGVMAYKGTSLFDTRGEAVAHVRSGIMRHLAKWQELQAKAEKL